MAVSGSRDGEPFGLGRSLTCASRERQQIVEAACEGMDHALLDAVRRLPRPQRDVTLLQGTRRRRTRYAVATTVVIVAVFVSLEAVLVSHSSSAPPAQPPKPPM
jgi:hypothetical protein